MTPWVGRLIAANAVALLLMETVLTSPALANALAFDPATALRHPWTFVSYLFVHQGLLHLLVNMLALWAFGTALESKLGGRQFLFYYLYCGVGAAVFCLGLSGLMGVRPFVGASGSVLGLATAFAIFWPDAELMAFPIPVPIRARTLVVILVLVDVTFALIDSGSQVAHLAHVGGALFGYLFFRVQELSRRGAAPPARSVERMVMVQSGRAEPEHATPITPIRTRRRAEPESVAAEVDRVLDKISAHGLQSLTPAERRFLDEVSKKKQQGEERP